MKRDLVVLHSFPGWLSQTLTWIYTQVRELQCLNNDIHVVCEYAENLNQFYVNNIHCFTEESLFTQFLDRGLRKMRLRRHLGFIVKVGRLVEANIVHSHFGNIAWTNLNAVRKIGAKHVVTFYGLDVNQLPNKFTYWRKRYIQLFREGDLFLCEGSHMAGALIKLGCPPQKIRVHHLGVNLKEITFKAREYIYGTPVKILIAASFREKKGITYGLEALEIVSKSFPVELTIIGDAGNDLESQHEKKRILNLLKTTGLEKYTRLLGYRSHDFLMKEAYDHHIFLQPSVTALDGDTEGGAPVSIIEMLASGMPVVSTMHCDIPEVMGPFLASMLVPERNVDALANCLKKTIKNSNHWNEYGKAGRAQVEHGYDKNKQALTLLSFYEDLISK